jgi:hypothetical protein
MKAYVNVLILFFGFTTLTYSQEKNTGPNMENLPAVVIKSIEMTFQYTCLIEMRTLKSEHCRIVLLPMT